MAQPPVEASRGRHAAPATPPPDRLGVAAVLLATTIWGASFVLAKVALREMSVTHLVLLRFAFAAIALLPFLLGARRRIDPRDLPLFALNGFLMVPATALLQFEGLARTSAASAALMVGVGTPLLAIAAVVFERERVGPRTWGSVAGSTLGMAFMVGLPGSGRSTLGDLLVLASIVVSVVWILASKRLVERYSAFLATGWSIVLGTAALVPIALLRAGVPPTHLAPRSWTAVIGLAVGCTVMAYVAWNWGVARIGAASAGVWLNLEPVTGAMLGVTLLGESLTPGLAVGGILILAAAGAISIGPPRGTPLYGGDCDGAASADQAVESDALDVHVVAH